MTAQAPIPIALCCTTLERGGAERCLVELARGLDRRRFSPTVYSLAPRPDRPERSFWPELEASGVPVRSLEVRRPRGGAQAVWRLSRWLRRDRVRLVQGFLFHANMIARLAVPLAGNARMVSGIRVAERRGRWRLRLDRASQRLVDRHVCVSQSVADFSRREGGLTPSRLVVIPNGVDFDRIDRAVAAEHVEQAGGESRRWLIGVGRLDRQKGFDRLLDIAPEMMRGLPQHDLVIVGDGPQRPALIEQAARAGLAERVHFLGWRADVNSLLKASDLFLLPSRWEGLPNVLLEAMAAALPVVAADVEGVRELLGPTAESQLVTGEFGPGFLRQVRQLAADEPGRRALGELNARRARDAFSWGGMVRAYERLYEELLGTG